MTDREPSEQDLPVPKWLTDRAAQEDARPSEDRLREAVIVAAENVDGCWHDAGDHVEYHGDLAEALIALRRTFAPLDAALAASRPAPDTRTEALDVERLIEALYLANRYDPASQYADIKRQEVREFARDIAAEYAAISPSKGSDPA